MWIAPPAAGTTTSGARFSSSEFDTLTGISATLDSLSSPRSNARLHVNSWFAFIPCARATSATLAPGFNANCTIFSFSEIDRQRTDAPNQVWHLGFVADQLSDGRRFRALTVMDVFTRESLAIEVGQKLKGEDVVSILNEIRRDRGTPKFLRCDNGSEFTSQIMDLWAYHKSCTDRFFTTREADR